MHVVVAGIKQERMPDLAERLGLEKVTFVKDADSLPEDTTVLFSWLYGQGSIDITHAPNLIWIHQAGAGVDAVLTPSIVSSDVVMTNSAGVFDDAIAEFVLGMALALTKGFPRSFRQQQDHEWNHFLNGRIAGKRALVIGAGSIGCSIRSQLLSAHMQTTMVGRTSRQDPLIGKVYASGDIPSLLSDSDIVILAAPLTPETDGLVDQAFLDAMPNSAHLINIGRGRIVDTAALIYALQQGSIAGAALDVVDPEPLPSDHPIWETPGVMLTPHHAGDYAEHRSDLIDLFVSNFGRYTSGAGLLNLIDKKAGY